MTRSHGRAPRGQRLHMGAPHRHWRTTTFVGALHLRGMIAPFAKMKALLRQAAELTVEGLWSAIGRSVGTVIPQECANFFAAAGIDPY